MFLNFFRNPEQKKSTNGGGSVIFPNLTKFSNPTNTEKLKAIKENDWVFGAVDLRAEVFSDVEVKLFRKNKNDEKIEVKKHKALDMLLKPNRFTTLFELLEITSMQLDLGGESFWLVDKSAGNIWWLMPQYVKIIPDPVNFIKEYEYTVGNTTKTYSPDEIIHFKKPDPANPYKVISPLDAIARTYNLDQNANEFNWKFFKNGGLMSMILYFKQKLGAGIFKRFVSKFRAEYTGTENANKIAFLEHEMGTINLDRTQRDMQFVELQDKTRDKILGAGFRVSRTLLGLDENSNRATIDGTQYGFRAFINRPRLRRLFSKLNAEFLPLFGDYFGQKLFFEFVDKTPKDEDMILKKRDSDLEHGVISINEVRDREGLDPVQGGDSPRIPFNLMRLDDELILETERGKTKNKTKKFQKPNKKNVLKEYLKRFNASEAKFTKEMQIYFGQQEDQILNNLKFDKNFLNNFEKKINLGSEKNEEKKIFAKIFPLLLLIAENEGKQAIAELGLADQFLIKKIRKKLSKQTQRFAKFVTSTTFNLLKNEIATSLEQGESENEIANRIKKVFKNAKQYRAKTIARTEVNLASNTAHKQAYKDLGVPAREWVSSHDRDTRVGHESADGQVVKLNEKFKIVAPNGETEHLDYPSDSVHGSAGNCINCRCRTIAHFYD